MIFFQIVLQVLIWCALGYAGGCIAAHKGYSPRTGAIVTVILGPIGLIVYAVLPPTKEGREQAELERQQRLEAAEFSQRKNCPDCGREVSVRAPVCPRCEHRFV
jgi:hypothetical protein